MSLSLIALTMFIVLVIFLFMGHPLAFVLGGVGTLYGFIFLGPDFLGLFVNRVVGLQNNFVLVAVTLFILMGNLLTRSGIADALFKSMTYLLGSVRGGLGIAVIFVCIIFAACTGIIGASVVTMGLLGGPLLIKRGYQRELVTGLIAAGGSLGILIPPSVMLVIMGDQASISVGKLLLGAVVPGISMGVLYMIYIAVRCGINPEIGPPVPAEELAVPAKDKIISLLKNGVPPVVLIIGVLGSIFTGQATPTEAAGVGAFLSFVLMVVYKKITWENFLTAIYQTGKTTTMVMIIVVGASCFTAVFIGMGGGTTLINTLLGMGLSKWGLYILMMAMLIVLGMFIDWVGIVLIVFPIFMPIANELGFDPVWFVMMMAINLQMSFLTPPFGYALFYLSSMDLPGVKLSHIYRGVLPFVAIQIVALIFFTTFPQLILWLPSLMAK